MKQTFDTDSIVFKMLKSDSGITSAISGGIYIMQRPDNSTSEDIVINTIALSQDFEPQIGTSNINIHVADKAITIAGVQQKVADLARLKQLTTLVLAAVRTITVSGLTLSIESQNTIQEPDVNQHYVNIRINWNIHE